MSFSITLKGTKAIKKNEPLFIIVFLGLFIVTLIPIWTVHILPLQDYPNHYARMYIITNIEKSTILQQFYSIKWSILPNLIMDIMVPFFAKVMPLEISMKLFISLILFLIASSTCALHYILHGRLSFFSLLVFLFLYNYTFLMGIFNYSFGMGLALWGIALWIYFEKKSFLLRIIIFSIISLSLFFCHIVALGVYGLFILGLAIYKWIHKDKQFLIIEWLITLSQFVLPIILLIIFLTIAQHKVNAYPGIKMTLLNIPVRLLKLVYYPLYNYSYFSIGITFFFLTIFFLYSFLKKNLFFAEKMIYPLGLVFFFYLVIPDNLLGGLLYNRIAVFIWFIMLASINVSIQSSFKRNIAVVLILFVFFTRMCFVNYYWQNADRQYTQYIDAFHKMEEGKTLFPIFIPNSWVPFFPIPIEHISCLSVIERLTFVPSLFTASQPLLFTSYYDRLEPYAGNLNGKMGKFDLLKLNWETISVYDYLLITDFSKTNNKYSVTFYRLVPNTYIEIYRGDEFRLFKHIRPTEKF